MRPALLLTLTLTATALAQTPENVPGVAERLRAPKRTVPLADLPERYRAVTINPGVDLLSTFVAPSLGEDFQASLLIAALGATWVDPDEFEALLGGKRPRIRALRLDRNDVFSGKPSPGGAPVFVETWLEPGAVARWSPLAGLDRKGLTLAFPPALFGDQSLPPGYAEHVVDAGSVSDAIQRYLESHNGRFFRADSTAAAKSQVEAYLPNVTSWPDRYPDGRRLLFNTGLSGKRVADLGYPSDLLVLFEDRPGPDGRYAVSFLSGETRLADRDEWETLREEARVRARETPKKAATEAKPKGKGKGRP